MGILNSFMIILIGNCLSVDYDPYIVNLMLLLIIMLLGFVIYGLFMLAIITNENNGQ